MTEELLKSLPEGTRVSILESFDCHEAFYKGGTLVFQDDEDKDDDEYNYGIEVDGIGACFEIPYSYFVVENLIQANAKSKTKRV